MTNFKELTRFDGVKVWVNFALVTRYNSAEDAGKGGTTITFDKENALLVKETPDEIRTR